MGNPAETIGYTSYFGDTGGVPVEAVADGSPDLNAAALKIKSGYTYYVIAATADSNSRINGIKVFYK